MPMNESGKKMKSAMKQKYGKKKGAAEMSAKKSAMKQGANKKEY